MGKDEQEWLTFPDGKVFGVRTDPGVTRWLLHLLQRLLEIRQQLAPVLDADRDAHQHVADAGFVKFLGGHVVDEISLFLDDESFVCKCRTLRAGVESEAQVIPVFPMRGGVFLQLLGVPESEMVRVAISAGGRVWRSAYELLDTVDMRLERKER